MKKDDRKETQAQALSQRSVAGVRAFYLLCEEVGRASRYLYDQVGQYDREIQDVLHEMEFSEKMDRTEAARQARRLRAMRRERRACKNELEAIAPLLDWYRKHTIPVEGLKQVQGRMGALLERQETRMYVPRSNPCPETREAPRQGGPANPRGLQKG